MGSNFHTPWTTATTFTTGSMNPVPAALDKGITYLKNLIVHCDGDISFSAGILSWSGTLRILFTREDGTMIQNTVNAGTRTLSANQFAYVDLNETNDTVITVGAAAITTGSASNTKAVNRVVLGYVNSTNGDFFPVNLHMPLSAGVSPSASKSPSISPSISPSVSPSSSLSPSLSPSISPSLSPSRSPSISPSISPSPSA